MEIDNIIDDLNNLASGYLKGCETNNIQQTSQIISDYLKKFNLSPDSLQQILNEHFKINFPKKATSKNFELITNTLSLIFYLLYELAKNLNESATLLSVKQSKNLKSLFKTLSLIGVLSKVQNRVPFHCEIKNENLDDFQKYIILKNSVLCLKSLIDQKSLRIFMIPESLQSILVGSYQIAFCPLKKPTTESCSSELLEFRMTENIYQELLVDKEQFRNLLLELESKMHPNIFLRETMVLLQAKSPIWFKKSVSQTLTRFIRSKPNGLEVLINTILGEIDEDVAKNWKALDVIVKIILSCKQAPDFQSNIFGQLCELLENINGNRNRRIFALCTKELFKIEDSSFDLFLQRAVNPFLNFDIKLNENRKNLTDYLLVNIEILHLIFVDNSVDNPRLPSKFLNSIIDILYTFYSVLHPLKKFGNLKELLTTYLKDLKDFDGFKIVFDLFLFNRNNKFPGNLDLVVEKESEIVKLKSRDYKIINSVEKNARIVPMLLVDSNLKLQYFKYLLNCLIESADYFPKSSDFPKSSNFAKSSDFSKNSDISKSSNFPKSSDFLKSSNFPNSSDFSKSSDSPESSDFSKSSDFQKISSFPKSTDFPESSKFPKSSDFAESSDFFLSKSTENLMIVFQILSLFAEDKNIQKQITEKPEIVLNYFEKILNDNLELKVHKSDPDSSDFNTLFSVVMILHSLVDSKDCYKNFETPLMKIVTESENIELKSLAKDILQSMNKNAGKNNCGIDEGKSKMSSEFDKALEDICDSLLPTRGHGLMALTKLVEKKDAFTMEKKQYVLNIFLNNLKNDDSFIYLSAIGGLAAMADLFTDTVLETLCEEYAEFKRQDNEEHEVRMKLGEVLVRTTKKLGDMAPKYKPLLLNTFLFVAKDDDELVRASSLSNLAEICRILGTKLGTISSEILSCVFGIITGDKSIEARRAAVTVLRQLLAGLDSDMLLFLQDDMLSIYRALKVIYRSDGDEVMRLQAQLALEQINDNMKSLQKAVQQQLADEYCDTSKSVVLK